RLDPITKIFIGPDPRRSPQTDVPGAHKCASGVWFETHVQQAACGHPRRVADTQSVPSSPFRPARSCNPGWAGIDPRDRSKASTPMRLHRQKLQTSGWWEFHLIHSHSNAAGYGGSEHNGNIRLVRRDLADIPGTRCLPYSIGVGRVADNAL